jgi:hypothetical protein
MKPESDFDGLPLAEGPAQVLQIAHAGDQFSWVLFEHGTGVVFRDPGEVIDLASEAREVMSKWGPSMWAVLKAISPSGNSNPSGLTE